VEVRNCGGPISSDNAAFIACQTSCYRRAISPRSFRTLVKIRPALTLTFHSCVVDVPTISKGDRVFSHRPFVRVSLFVHTESGHINVVHWSPLVSQAHDDLWDPAYFRGIGSAPCYILINTTNIGYS